MTTSPPTLYLNGRFLTHRVTGVERFSIEVVRALDRLIDRGEIDRDRCRIELLHPRGAIERLDLTHIPCRQVGVLTGHLWEQLELPWHARGGTLLSPAMTSTLWKTDQLVVVHDAAVFANPRAFKPAFRLWYHVLLNLLMRVARRTITVSNFSRDELARHCGVDKGRIQVVYAGKEQITRIASDGSILERRGLTPGAYVLAVSSLSPNKNFGAIVTAMDLLPPSARGLDFVVAGGANPAIFRADGAESAAKHLGYVSDEELKALLENAACFVFPSFYEGFGLPPLEAMAVGCPVVVSDAASMPEVCGDAAVYCDPHDPADIAAKIASIIHDPQLRAQLSQAGLERADRFSWDRCAAELFRAAAIA